MKRGRFENVMGRKVEVPTFARVTNNRRAQVGEVSDCVA